MTDIEKSRTFTIADLTEDLGLEPDQANAVAAWSGLPNDAMVALDGTWKPCLDLPEYNALYRMWKTTETG